MRLALLVVLAAAVRSAGAQSTSTIPSEDFGWQRSIPAGPCSVLNTGTGTLLTAIPLVKLTGPGGTMMGFTLYHASTGADNSVVGQAARGWRHTYDEWIVPNNTIANLSTFAHRNTFRTELGIGQASVGEFRNLPILENLPDVPISCSPLITSLAYRHFTLSSFTSNLSLKEPERPKVCFRPGAKGRSSPRLITSTRTLQ